VFPGETNGGFNPTLSAILTRSINTISDIPLFCVSSFVSDPFFPFPVPCIDRAPLCLPHDDRRVRRLPPRHSFRIAQDRPWNETATQSPPSTDETRLGR
jgi:hypothetical protein